MQNFTTNAINLKSYNLSETDKIIVMYSKDKGIIKGVAKGAKKTTSKLGGRMDMLVANRLMLHKGRNLDTICQAQAINTFKNTRNDMDKLFYSIYCSEVVHSFGVENDPNSEEIYELFYKTLEAVSKSENKVQLLLSVIKFQLKITHIAGYSLELENCACCGGTLDNDNIYFSAQSGGTICEECKKHSINAAKLHHKIRDFLNTLLQLDYGSKTRYDELATEKICSFCFELMKRHVEQFSPKKIKSAQILEITK
jgi:DNA repair protein recO